MMKLQDARDLQGREVEWSDNRPPPHKGGQGQGGGVGTVASVSANIATIRCFDIVARELTSVIVPLEHLTMRARD